MVYNAMKLFMEVNPQLFDECSHDYTETQSSAPARQRARNAKWEQLSQQAKARQNGRIQSMKAGLGVQTGLAAPTGNIGPTIATQLEVHEGPAPIRGSYASASESDANTGGLSHERLHQFESMNITEEAEEGLAPGVTSNNSNTS
jgi:hypothetical protein